MNDPSPAPDPTATDRRMSPRRVVIQLVGYAAGIALLIWCVSRALSPENREQLTRLADASPLSIALLCGLSVLSIVLNGLIFWTAVRPVQRVPLGSVLATNAIATALNYVPFKLSMLSRILIHNRRDRVPLLTIGGWLGTVVIILAATLGPMVAISLHRPTIDGIWLALVSGAMVLAAGTVILGARLGLTSPVRRLSRSLTMRTALGRRFLSSSMEPHILDGLRMMSSPVAVGAGVGLRLADVVTQSARFVVAAGILGITLQFDKAFLLAATYFGIGIVSPFGMLGTREAGAAGLADALSIPNAGAIAAVVLLVSATEALVTIILATAGAIYLRPMRLMVKEVARIASEEAVQTPPSEPAPAPLPSADAPGSGTTQSDHR
ncbi:MAG: flippase-like domain-containing protein [Phycisphaeraceae bacterium]|nr:flippase-like domain-containing protein [Phycisphaeraceae bacterium]